jgi:hypothetical protein
MSHHYWFLEGETKRFSAPFRYVWPSELDLMARLAGMRLRERWSGWNREPFKSDCGSHVSVWQKLEQLPLGTCQIDADLHGADGASRSPVAGRS